MPVTTTEFGTEYNRAVLSVVVDAINNHGVTHRIIDGAHFLLYNGDRAVRPFKVSASRKHEETIWALRKWLEENVSTWPKREVTSDDLAALASRFNGDAAVPEPLPQPEPVPARAAPVDDEDWVPATSSSGRDWGFITNGKVWRCTYPECDYYQREARGLHLHAGSHTGQSKQYSKEAGKSRSERKAKDNMVVKQALTALAAAHGFVIIGRDEAKEIGKSKLLAERLARVERERDEAKARLQLIQEAMKA